MGEGASRRDRQSTPLKDVGKLEAARKLFEDFSRLGSRGHDVEDETPATGDCVENILAVVEAV
jgi:hypothetical protein